MEEAQQKINMYHKVASDLNKALTQRDELLVENTHTKHQLNDFQKLNDSLKDRLKNDQLDLMRLKEEKNRMKNDLTFYKDNSEKLEYRQTDELDVLNKSVKKMAENEKDLKQKLEIYQKENADCQHQNR